MEVICSTAQVKAERRQRRGLYTVTDVAQSLNVSKQALWYHILNGFIPRPSFGQSKRKYYVQAEVDSIRAYWCGQ